jgi:hypothetical protein
MTQFNFCPQWYNEYGKVRTHDYFTFMVNQFPVFAVRNITFLHDSVEVFYVAVLGITYQKLYNI